MIQHGSSLYVFHVNFNWYTVYRQCSFENSRWAGLSQLRTNKLICLMMKWKVFKQLCINKHQHKNSEVQVCLHLWTECSFHVSTSFRRKLSSGCYSCCVVILFSQYRHLLLRRIKTVNTENVLHKELFFAACIFYNENVHPPVWRGLTASKK